MPLCLKKSFKKNVSVQTKKLFISEILLEYLGREKTLCYTSTFEHPVWTIFVTVSYLRAQWIILAIWSSQTVSWVGVEYSFSFRRNANASVTPSFFPVMYWLGFSFSPNQSNASICQQKLSMNIHPGWREDTPLLYVALVTFPKLLLMKLLKN